MRGRILPGIFLIGAMIVLSPGCKPKYRQQEPAAIDFRPDTESLYRANQKLIKDYEKRIRERAATQGWILRETGTGVFFQVMGKPGIEKPKIEAGDRVSLEYRLSLLDGTSLYSSKADGLKQFAVDRSEAEPGLHEAIKFLSAGDSARVIIPPQRAFGLTGDGNRIPPGAILVYEIKVDSVSVRKNN